FESITKRMNPDRLSALPDDILHHILAFLDVKSYVQTSILSGRWRSVWKYVRTINFVVRNRFSSDWRLKQQVDQILSLRSDSSSLTRVVVDFDLEQHMDLFNRIAKYAASHGVQELSIKPSCNCNIPVVSQFVYACSQSLKVLEINGENCPMGHKYDEFWSRLQMLQSLTLTNCYLYRGNVAFTNFPRLKSLKLIRRSSYSMKPGVLNVTAPELLNLEIYSPAFTSFEIVAPKLQSFSLEIEYLCRIQDTSKSNLPSLNRAKLRLSDYRPACCPVLWENDLPCKQRVIKRCAKLFKILHNVQVLDIEVDPFELLIKICNSKKRPSPFKRMKSLNLNYRSLDNVPDQVVRYFLGDSSNQEGKTVTVEMRD
ncbi:F-box protein At4g27050, partial [Linum grandiflorum]